jgi:hypothetical protein
VVYFDELDLNVLVGTRTLAATRAGVGFRVGRAFPGLLWFELATNMKRHKFVMFELIYVRDNERNESLSR